MAHVRDEIRPDSTVCPVCSRRSWRKTIARWGQCFLCRCPTKRLAECPKCTGRVRQGTLQKYGCCRRCYGRHDPVKYGEYFGKEKQRIIEDHIRWLQNKQKITHANKSVLLLELWLQNRQKLPSVPLG